MSLNYAAAAAFNWRRIGGWAPRAGIDETSADFADEVARYQAFVGIAVDGLLGRETIAAIVALVLPSRDALASFDEATAWGGFWDDAIHLPGEHNLPHDRQPQGGSSGGGGGVVVDEPRPVVTPTSTSSSKAGGGGGWLIVALGVGLIVAGSKKKGRRR